MNGLIVVRASKLHLQRAVPGYNVLYLYALEYPTFLAYKVVTRIFPEGEKHSEAVPAEEVRNKKLSLKPFLFGHGHSLPNVEANS